MGGGGGGGELHVHAVCVLISVCLFAQVPDDGTVHAAPLQMISLPMSKQVRRFLMSSVS